MAKKKVLAIIGGQWHTFEACGTVLKELAEATGRFDVEVTQDRNALKAGPIQKFDAVIVYAQGGKLTREQESGLLGFVSGGGAFVGLHSAAASWQENRRYVEMLGAAFGRHGPAFEFPVNVVSSASWVTQRIQGFRITDELYLLDRFDPSEVTLLATAQWKGDIYPIAYSKSYGDGRVFYLALGHDERAFRNPSFRKLVVRGLDWALHREPRKTLKAGCIGYGASFNISRLHFESMTAAGLEVAAACDIDPARAKAAESEWPGIKGYLSAARMLARSEVELVAVNTPHNSHARLAIQCLNAGRHVVTEKPMCITVQEADAMIATAKKHRRMLSVFHNRRWDGDYMTIKDVIARGLLGDVFQIELCGGGYGHPGYWWRSNKRIAGGSFYDWGAHFVDWVLGLVPAPITEIGGHFVEKAVWHDATNEDHCQAVVRFANGCSASVELSHLAAVGKSRWRILGTKGALLDLGNEKFQVVTYRDGVRTDCQIPYLPSDWHAYYRNIADHLLLGEPLTVTAESARRVIALIETAEKSSRAGKVLPPPKGCA